MATQNAKGTNIEQKTAMLRNGGKSPESSWSASVFCEICDRSLHCQEFASFKSTIFVAQNNALVNL
jgi:hypothetical protein